MSDHSKSMAKLFRRIWIHRIRKIKRIRRMHSSPNLSPIIMDTMFHFRISRNFYRTSNQIMKRRQCSLEFPPHPSRGDWNSTNRWINWPIGNHMAQGYNNFWKLPWDALNQYCEDTLEANLKRILNSKFKISISNQLLRLM